METDSTPNNPTADNLAGLTANQRGGGLHDERPAPTSKSAGGLVVVCGSHKSEEVL